MRPSAATWVVALYDDEGDAARDATEAPDGLAASVRKTEAGTSYLVIAVTLLGAENSLREYARRLISREVYVGGD